MVCFSDLEKYGLKFEDGWAVDKNGKKVAQAQNFCMDMKHYLWMKKEMFLNNDPMP